MKAKNLLKSILIIMLAIVAATSATACSSDGSNIGDDKETEKQLDIYIVSGQSNAVGFSRWGDSRKEYKNVYYLGYGEGTEPLDYAFMINVQSGLGVNGNCFGPEMGMAAYLSEQYKNDETTDVAIVNSAGAEERYGITSCHTHPLMKISVQKLTVGISATKTTPCIARPVTGTL